MSEVRNATEFRLLLQRSRGIYERQLARGMPELTAKLPPDPYGIGQRELQGVLEAHVREHFVNALLAALNWRTGTTIPEDPPNLEIEVAVRSVVRGKTRFLDYLGADSTTRTPLLIVETKRPTYELPQVIESGKKAPATYGDILARGLAAQRLSGEWNEWLETLRDYVLSSEKKWGRVPRRVVITNGDWLVVFLDPSDAFSKTKGPDALKILVCPTAEDIEARSSEVFMQLEYYKVVGRSPALHAADVGFHLDPGQTRGVLHGLRLLYVEDPRIGAPAYPLIRVAPVVFVMLASGGLVQVDGRSTDFPLPDSSSGLPGHLDDVSKAASQLLEEVRTALKPNLPLLSFPDEGLNGVESVLQFGIRALRRADGWNEYVLVTGTHTHFCHPLPSVKDCPYHNWEASAKDGVAATREPRHRRSVSPRSFFRSGEINHCSHSLVALSKAALVSPENAPRCGWRGLCTGEGFCGIWEFETELCPPVSG